MNVCHDASQLENFLKLATEVSKKHPVVVSEFLERCKEIEIDAVAQNGEIMVYAISEHVEFAGVHSGDATTQFPPQKIYVETIRRIKKIAGEIARSLNISGPFNIQFLAKDNYIKVIECNLRSSRSFPFVSKVLKLNFIELATKVMLGLPVEKPEKSAFDLDYVGIKASQFSFHRLQQADPGCWVWIGFNRRSRMYRRRFPRSNSEIAALGWFPYSEETDSDFVGRTKIESGTA
jgi:carbamoyl-phosphate synthase large subunit